MRDSLGKVRMMSVQKQFTWFRFKHFMIVLDSCIPFIMWLDFDLVQMFTKPQKCIPYKQGRHLPPKNVFQSGYTFFYHKKATNKQKKKREKNCMF